MDRHSKHALELKGVVKHYGRRKALDGFDLSVPSGSIFGLVGGNGAGKTTSMAVSMGFLRPAAGSVSLFGEGPFQPARHAGRVSLLPQDARLPPHSRVEELLRFYGRLQGLSESELRRSIDEVLEWTNLTDRRRSAIRTLSHGMMRRVTIAQAFLGNPELVLLDEPLSGLDPRQAADVRDAVRRRRGRQTIVVSSHILSDIEMMCDTVAFVDKGRLSRQDTLEAITRRGHRIVYSLESEAFPAEELKAALPQCEWEFDSKAKTLAARFDGDAHAVSAVNAIALPTLLRAAVGVLEIRRGSDLESEYLAATAMPPSEQRRR